MRETVREKKLCDCNSGASGSVYNDFAVFLFLTGNFKCIDDTCKNNDSGSVLVIMENRDIKKLF